jgi:hypothetical protein
MREFALVDTPQIDGGNEIWIEALPAKIFHTPQYGQVSITYDKLKRFVQNFNSRVRGQDIATDFNHGMDRAKGNQASGWFKELAIKPHSQDPTLPSLFARIELTDDARKELGEKKWRYFSLEWEDLWTDNNGKEWQDVITGGGFTNRPVAKNMMPINFSEAMWQELDYETKKQFAVWTTKTVNDLPDSAFLYVQPGGSKDSEGKTVPRSLRHFPYKGSDGKIDLPHLRNAIARIPQAGSWLSASMKNSLQSRARKMLSNAGGSPSMGETLEENLNIIDPNAINPEMQQAIISAANLLEQAGYTFKESKEWEHSEPGTGTPPAPNLGPESGITDPAIVNQWRRETPPGAYDDPVTGLPEGGTTPPIPAITPLITPPQSTSSTNVTQVTPVTPPTTPPRGGKKLSEGMSVEQEYELRNILGITSDGDVIEAARLQLGELTELKRTVDAASQERKFAEDYPAFWGEHNKLMNRDRENSARQFSESVSRVRKAEGFGLKETAKGLSSMSLSKVTELHKHFAEGTATIEEFEDCMRTIVNGGIVEFGEIGSSATDDMPIVDTSSAPGIATARKLFAEVVSKIQKDNPEMDYMAAITEAGKRHPDLAEAYSVALPA